MGEHKTAFVLVLILCFAVISISQSGVVKADAETIVVPDDYSTIQMAIDNAAEGATIFVKSGDYKEHLFINKSVSLVGEQKETTTILTFSSGYPTVLVRHDNVNITGFTIRHSESSKLADLHLLGASYCNIHENIMVNSYYGIWLHDTHDNNIIDNTVDNNDNGILVEKSFNTNIIQNRASNGFTGIWLKSSSNSTLRNNNITDFTRHFGVSGTSVTHYFNDIDSSNVINNKKIYYLVNQKNVEINSSDAPIGFLGLVNCTDITVQDVNLTANVQGIVLVNTSNSAIKRNNMTKNLIGLWLLSSSNVVFSENQFDSNSYAIQLLNSNNSLFYNNNFIFSYVQQVDDQYSNESSKTGWAPSVNQWDNGTTGNYWGRVTINYWTNYRGSDSNRDGIGDLPYTIDVNNHDNYPLMHTAIIPEFTSWMILPIFVTATLAALIVKKKLFPSR